MMRHRMPWLLALCISVSACLTTPVLAQNGKHLFILSGQSNMRQPLPDAFKASVSQVFGQDKVIVVTHAHPSQPIRRWYKNWIPPKGVEPDEKPNGTLYDALMKRVAKAIAGKSLASVTFIWMQGEADAGQGWGAVYEKSFLGVLEQFTRDLKRDRIHFVLGRINDYWLASKGVKDGDVVRAAHVKLGKDHPNGDWVDTDDLNTGVNPWGIYEIDGGHFPTPAYRVLGQRFARKACKLIDPDAQLDDRHFGAVFCDTADDIKSHQAIGKKISGTKPDAKRRGGGKGLPALLDGKYGSADPTDGHWLAFPPTPKGVELVVDLGSRQSVTGIGVDILINKKAGALFPKSMAISMSDDGKESLLSKTILSGGGFEGLLEWGSMDLAKGP